MKMPVLKGKTRIRDASICHDYLEAKLSITEIADKHHITPRHVYRVIYKHADVINLNLASEKLARVRWLKQQIEKAGDSGKDSMELVDQLRKEIEGDKPFINVEEHSHITYVWQSDKNKVPATTVPNGDSRGQL